MRWKSVVTSGIVCGVLAASACAPAPTMVASGETSAAPPSSPAPASTPTPSATPERSASPAPSTPASTPTATPSSEASVTPSAEPSEPKETKGTQPPTDASTAAPGDRPDCSKLRCIALTFDDGPGPHTKQLLDDLAKTGSKATFFVLGPNVTSRPELIKRMANEGHQIGNHSWSHSQFSRLSSQKVLSEVERTSTAVKKITGHGTKTVRPPYGDFNKSTRSTLANFAEGEIILWSVDTLDWKTRSTAKTIASVKKEARPGAIVLMHDIHKPTVAAVPAIVDYLRSKGYTLVTVDDLLAPENPQPGHVFTHLG